MESLVRDVVIDHFVSNNLFSDKQYGFIKGKSTVLQLLKITDSWTNSLDDDAQVDIICDLGPSLLSYINDLPSVCDSSSNLFLFADDAKLYKSNTTNSDCNTLQSVCQELFN